MRILITSGGGAKGAFSVGALQYLTQQPGGFDFISGTSTGSLIAAMIAANKLQTLVDVYRNTTNQMILKPVDLVDAADKKLPYLYDTLPLTKQLDSYLDHAAYTTIMNSAVRLCFNSVCLQNGKISVFTTKPVNASPSYDSYLINSLSMMKDGMMGSSNQAAFMPPVEFNGKQFVDGGNREVIPTRVVVQNIPSNQPHDIYVLSNNPLEFRVDNKIFKSILEVLFRAVTMFIQEVRENDMEALTRFKQSASKPVRIFYIYPDTELDIDYPTGLRFDKFRMRTWMTEGAAKAQHVVTKFPNGNWGLVA